MARFELDSSRGLLPHKKEEKKGEQCLALFSKVFLLIL